MVDFTIDYNVYTTQLKLTLDANYPQSGVVESIININLYLLEQGIFVPSQEFYCNVPNNTTIGILLTYLGDGSYKELVMTTGSPERNMNMFVNLLCD